MEPLPFLDTNIFLRHLRQDHPDHSPRATALFARIRRGEAYAQTLDTVVFETVYTLQSFYKETRSAIRETLLPLINLPGIVLPDKQRYARAFEIYATSSRSFADSFHIAHAEQAGIREFISFDRDFDGLPNIRRVEP